MCRGTQHRKSAPTSQARVTSTTAVAVAVALSLEAGVVVRARRSFCAGEGAHGHQAVTH